MSEKINIRKTLRVFNTIVTQGHRSGNDYVLNGLSACTDFDGYTITIRNDYVRLDIFFHNKISFDCTSKKEMSQFLEKINAMDQSV